MFSPLFFPYNLYILYYKATNKKSLSENEKTFISEKVKKQEIKKPKLI